MCKKTIDTAIDNAFEEYLQSKGILIHGDNQQIIVKIDFGSDFLYNKSYIFELIQYYMERFAPNILNEHLKIKAIELYCNDLVVDIGEFNQLAGSFLHNHFTDTYTDINICKGGVYDE